MDSDKLSIGKRITYRNTGDSLEIINRIRHMGILVYLSIVLIIILSVTILFLVTEPSFKLALIFVAEIVILAPCILMWLWLLFGKEVIIVERDKFVIKSDLFGYGFTKNFDTAKLGRFGRAGFVDRLTYQFWHFSDRLKCSIAFNYLGRKQLFGKELREKNADAVIALINEQLKQYSR